MKIRADAKSFFKSLTSRLWGKKRVLARTNELLWIFIEKWHGWMCLCLILLIFKWLQVVLFPRIIVFQLLADINFIFRFWIEIFLICGLKLRISSQSWFLFLLHFLDNRIKRIYLPSSLFTKLAKVCVGYQTISILV